MSTKQKKYDVVVIGAGFGGVGMGVALKAQGIDDFVIFEGGSSVGGSWLTNKYPGCACDVPSHLYSYSFEPNPDWPEAYSSHKEIYEYISRVADKYDVRKHVQFDTRVSTAVFQSDDGLWKLELANGDIVLARMLIPATGALSLPKFPKIKGRELFKGEQIHAAQWHESIDLKGKRIAVIGTGASAIQVVPSVAADVKSMHVFQRTPAWVLPKMNRKYSKAEKSKWRKYPFLQKLSRWSIYGAMEVAAPALIWFPSWLKVGKAAHAKHIRRSIKDPELRRKLTPSYELGCKRALVSDDYYQTFNKGHVHLVTEGAQEIDETGIRLADGKHLELDAIVYTTGYDIGMPMYPFEVRGSNGVELADYWNGQPKALYGMSVSNFPNMGLIMGPNAGPGHTSVLIYQESQYKYLAKMARYIIDNNVKSIDVKEDDVQTMFNWAQNRMKNSTWLSGCQSWYLNDDGTNSTMWPGFSFEYIYKTRNLLLDSYIVKK